jgi:RimJ/RimL family protein N-acetyltransferase
MAVDYHFGVTLIRLDREKHADQTFVWRNDVRIRKWCRQNDVLFRPAHNAWFDKQCVDPKTQMYAIQHDGRMVGVCGLTDMDLLNRRAEFSIYIGPEHQGGGIASAALKTLFSHGFMAYGLNCIWGETFDGNPAAKLFLRMGMIYEGKRRDFYFRDGRFVDSLLYSLLRRDWDRLFPAWSGQRKTLKAPADSEVIGFDCQGAGHIERRPEGETH